jgi:hypothetical protein
MIKLTLVSNLNTQGASFSSTTTGLDVHYTQEHTSPPPNWENPGHDHPTIWNFYSNLGKSYDSDLVKDSTNTVEVLLIFVRFSY